MAYNYLELVNKVCRTLNEVELTSTTFAGSSGVYGRIKDSVNFAIRDINQKYNQWPWFHTSYTETLVAGTTRYNFPADCKYANMDTFRISANASLGNDTIHLKQVSYEKWLELAADEEYDSDSTGTPRFVFETLDNNYGLSPTPDKAYSLHYEYFTVVTDLVNYTDVPTLPVEFESVIISGALSYVYQFKKDYEASNMETQKFENKLKELKQQYINRYNTLGSTMITRPYSQGRYLHIPSGS